MRMVTGPPLMLVPVDLVFFKSLKKKYRNNHAHCIYVD